MKKGTVVDQNDIKRILAEYFGVSEENIIKAQYSYIVVSNEDDEAKD